MLRAVLLVLASAALFASDIQAPAIPIDAEAEYYRADAQVAHIRPAWEAANADLQAAVVTLQRLCGEKFQPQMDGKHLVCVPKQNDPEKK